MELLKSRARTAEIGAEATEPIMTLAILEHTKNLEDDVVVCRDAASHPLATLGWDVIVTSS